jgi:hypothetical protein
MRTFVGFWFVLTLWSTAALGRDIFVDNVSGDDHFTGELPGGSGGTGGPVRTIAKALRLARSGDAIVLAKTDVAYRESVTLEGSRQSGTKERPFAIRGNGAVLDGSAPVPAGAWESYQGAIFRFRPRQGDSQQLFLDGRPAVQVTVAGSSGGPPELKPRQWCFRGGYVYFCVEQTKLPADYQLAYARERAGITLFHVDYVTIANLTVQGFQLDGINLYNTARDVSLVDVLCRGNGRSGVAVGGASTVEIEASRLGDNGQAQLLTLPYSQTDLRETHLLSNTAPGWVDQGGRVYRDGKRLTGGLDEFRPTGQRRPPP